MDTQPTSASASSVFTADTVSVVFGGTAGIGRAVADALGARPGRVVVTGRSTDLDIADPAAVEAFLAEIGPVDPVAVTGGVIDIDGGALIQ